MRLPSIDHLRERALATLLRFPLVLLAAAVGTGLIIAETESTRGIFAAALGLSLLTGVELFGERRGWSATLRIGAGIACIPFLVLYFLFLPAELNEGDVIRFMMLNVGFHLFVAFAPFIRRGSEKGFWQFNQTLFIGIATAVLYSATLTIGLVLALISIDRLFDVRVDGEVYADVIAVVFGIFNTWFFLSLVPSDFEELDRLDRYPKGLKVFAQYVLLPLVTVYLAILYAYGAKIVLEWEWPHGWVSALVLGYGVAGILSLLLLYPLRENDGNRWIAIFSRWFYAALIPLVALLIPAVWKRIATYGVTEERYIVAVLGLWLVGICGYFLVSRGKRIRMVPISLCIVALAACYGPWSARSVSVDSQMGRFRRAMVESGMLVDGRYRPPSDSLSAETETSIESMIYYLSGRGMLDELKRMGGASKDIDDAWKLITALGLDGMRDGGGVDQFQVKPPSVVSVEGYSYSVDVMYSSSDSIRPAGSWVTDGHRMGLQMDSSRTLRVTIDGDSIAIPLDSLIRTQVIGHEPRLTYDDVPAPPEGTMPPCLIAVGEGREWRGKMLIHLLTWMRNADDSSIGSLRGRLLIGRRTAAEASAARAHSADSTRLR